MRRLLDLGANPEAVNKVSEREGRMGCERGEGRGCERGQGRGEGVACVSMREENERMCV